ncbi:MAG: hypothetical protein ACR5KV_01855 [Wolbachia sp.]
MYELGNVVNEATESGVRFNFSYPESVYENRYESRYNFTDYVIKRISELKRTFKLQRI